MVPSERLQRDWPPDSPDIARFLDLPVASVEWDGAHHFSFYLFSRSDLITGCKFQKKTGGDDGPLTPWELPMTSYHHDYDEKGDDNDERDNYGEDIDVTYDSADMTRWHHVAQQV